MKPEPLKGKAGFMDLPKAHISAATMTNVKLHCEERFYNGKDIRSAVEWFNVWLSWPKDSKRKKIVMEGLHKAFEDVMG